MTAVESSFAEAAWHSEEPAVSPRSYWREVGQRYVRNVSGMVATGVLAVLVLSAIFAPLLTGYDPGASDPLHRLLPVGSSGHLLGTDELGRDMTARLLYGGRTSLLNGFVPVLGATVAGLALGMWAGLSRPLTSNVIMRSMDVLYAFPAILLAISISTSLGPGISNAMIATTIIFVPPVCRIAQAATREIAVKEYVEAARMTGAGTVRLVRTQILPNVFTPVAAYASGLLGISMIIAASLSFLGLGIQPPTPEWGFMLQSLRGSIYGAAIVATLPGAMIFLTSIAFNRMSDAFQEAMNVRSS
ncbi:ABC transporter permease [Amycolatopsis sp. GM8]|uniref:ABC transporter permease n=1 Tax=Amycolatopsis sp. GM8 TaxID=2896530 RepID=UPI001F378A7E|nr:ABC transporter permease [Amycolatopsis sp. GM8]